MKNGTNLNKGNSAQGPGSEESINVLNAVFISSSVGAAAKGGVGGGDGSGNGGGSGSSGNNGGSMKGDLYGDQYIVLRDLNSEDGGGDGEPILDSNGQSILIGTNGEPIYFVVTDEGEYEIAPEDLTYVQTVELGRANVARAPSKVMEKALDAALEKIEAGTNLTVDAAGRIVVDGVTIDSPLENLALYKYLMTAGGEIGWPDVVDYWPSELQALVGSNTLDPDWSPASLLGTAFDKTAPISLDAVMYQDTVLGVNKVTYINGEMQVDYFDFTNGSTESFNYDRTAYYGDTWLQWYADTDGDPSNLELVQASVMEAVFDGQSWSDTYIQVASDGISFETVDAVLSGTNDFAQAVEDARAVINFMHETGAIEITPIPMMLTTLPVEDEMNILVSYFSAEEHNDDHEVTFVAGTNQSDVIETKGGPQSIYAGNGKDMIFAGGGADMVDGGNGKDYLSGEGGPDALFGGNGDDVLYGGAGPDVLTGGNGYDVFVYQSASDAPSRGGDEHDEFKMIDVNYTGETDEGMRFEKITDFNSGEDLIHLQMMGITSFSENVEVNAIWVEQQGLDAVVYADLNGEVGGSNPAELEITLLDVNANDISASNFLF
jgi:Ca2+-binding RTX toxin-like protein